MRRQEFLKSVLIYSLGGVLFFRETACKGSTTPSSSGSSTDSKSFTSSVDQGHSHTVSLSKTEVQSPPAAGISRQTSSSSGHTHTFAMSQDQLSSVNSGGTVVITTSTDSGHSHTFTIQKWF